MSTERVKLMDGSVVVMETKQAQAYKDKSRRISQELRGMNPGLYGEGLRNRRLGPWVGSGHVVRQAPANGLAMGIISTPAEFKAVKQVERKTEIEKRWKEVMS